MATLCVGFALSKIAAAGETFGMRLQPVPRDVAAVSAPVVIRAAPTNECCVLTRRDGTIELYSITKPASDSVSVMRSRDGGLTWSDPEAAFPLPGRAYYAVKALEGVDGALHAVAHVYGEGPGGYRGRLYEVYYTRRDPAGAAWATPRRIVPGYVGSIRGFTELESTGRLVLAVARAIPERQTAPKAGPDLGWNNTFVYHSDDHGTTWQQSGDELTLALTGENVTRHGAIEPVVLGLRDGRVWMLVRDRGGRLWQSISTDGAHWPALVRSPFISSDSPAELLRLRNGKIILFLNACQNWSNARSYAMGGREVLQAAISPDDGKTWRGFREVLHEPDVATRGDRGTAYASAAETHDGKVVFVAGQGEGKRAIVMFDPRWLEEAEQHDDVAHGAVGWTSYGSSPLRVESATGRSSAVVLPLSLRQSTGAAWNFPMTDAGEISFCVKVPPGVTDFRVSLNDHFNRSDDMKAAEHCVFTLPLTEWLPSDPPGEHVVALRWSSATQAGELKVEVNGKLVDTAKAQRPAQFGVNYLRVEFRATTDNGGVALSQVSARSQ